MTKTIKPETLFGSGQHSANRKGRGKTKQRTMAEIVRERLRHVKDGKIVTHTLEEDTMLKLYVDAAKGDRFARRELLEKLAIEAKAAIGRRRSPPRTAQSNTALAVFREAIRVGFGPEFAIRRNLEAADVIYKIGDEWFIRPWAVALATDRVRARWE